MFHAIRRSASIARRRPTEVGVRRLVARGRSGSVYVERRPGAEPTVVRVFDGDPAADSVNVLFTGAPAPYGWSEEAVRIAFYRRRVLAPLVEVWLPGRLKVPRPLGFRFNDEARAWELRCELVHGRHAALHHPFSEAVDDEQRELRTQILRPLQRHLRDAGFIGALWQAGLGNPAAAGNFLRSSAPDAPRWIWFDLESAVPALLSPSPRALLGTYLPWSSRLGWPLFDQVDVPRVREYLSEADGALHDALGARGMAGLHRDVELLDRYQDRYAEQTGLERGITAALVRGRIDEEQAVAYLTRPGLWTTAELRRLAAFTVRAAWQAVRRLAGGHRDAGRARATCSAVRFLLTSRARDRAARGIAVRRLRSWTSRGQLGQREAGYLRRAARHRDRTGDLSDYAAHLALEPVSRTTAWILVPALAWLGWLSPGWLPIAWLLAGSASRSLYTLARGAPALARRRRFPWTALGVGALPVVGTLAYPCQMVRSARVEQHKLGALILYDHATAWGRRIPIWGGADTTTEHFFNRLPDMLVGDRKPLLQAPESSAPPGG